MLRKIYPPASRGGGEGRGRGRPLKKELCVSDFNTSDFLEETRVWWDGHPLWKWAGSWDSTPSRMWRSARLSCKPRREWNPQRLPGCEPAWVWGGAVRSLKTLSFEEFVLSIFEYTCLYRWALICTDLKHTVGYYENSFMLRALIVRTKTKQTGPLRIRPKRKLQ